MLERKFCMYVLKVYLGKLCLPLFFFLLSNGPVLADEGEAPEPPAMPEVDEGPQSEGDSGESPSPSPIPKNPKDSPPPPAKDPALFEDIDRKELSPSEKKAECQRYNGKLISFYGEVFQVKNCTRIRLSREKLASLSKGSFAPKEVTSQTLEALPLEDLKIIPVKMKTCAEMNGHYVSLASDQTSIFWTEKCKKRVFPDYDSFLEHRQKNKAVGAKTLLLTEQEMHFLADADPMPSILDSEFKMRYDERRVENIEELPQAKTCQNLVGKYVSYLDQIYLIVPAKTSAVKKSLGLCEKKAMDSVLFTRQNPRQRPKELSAAQFLAIPENL